MSFRGNFIRLGVAALMFLSVFFAPPFITAIFAFALAVRWRAWEVIAAGVLMDLLWLPNSIGFSLDHLPAASLISIVLVFGLEPLRRQLLLGPEIL
jgi:hypothetical protein